MQTQIKVPSLKVVFDQAMRKEITADIDSILASGMVATGPKTKEFEDFWAAYCGSRYAVACSNGGSALELIFKYLNIKGKDVLVPTNTFIATANAVLAARGNPIFIDADYKTMCVSLKEIEKRRTKDTVAVCIVHIGGTMSAELPQIADYCKKEGLYLIEDAAHAHGSDFAGRKAGKYGIAAAYSFFSTKVITSTEGGMVVTDDEGLADFTRSCRDYGKRSSWESVHTVISMNYRMSEICAVIGLAQARRLDEFIAHRSAIAAKYTAAFKGAFEMVIPEGRSSWYKFTIYLPSGAGRDSLKALLKERGISIPGGVYDIPVHLQPPFAHLGIKGRLSVAEDICNRHLCLPVFYGMTDEQIEYVISNINELTRG